MIQQDLTASVDPVKVSRREAFRRAYELYDLQGDEEQPRDLTGCTFGADLIERSGAKRLSLSETSGISRPTPNTVAVQLNTIQMGELTPGEYRLRLYSIQAGEREEEVIIIMQVE